MHLHQSVKSPALTQPSPFVAVKNGRFFVDGVPHSFVGANLWCSAYLGADAPFGNRERLRRELDRLAAMGVTNLRILAASERSPLRNAVDPAFHDQNEWNEALLQGLDFVLAEMAARGQRAVLYLTNFWEWSGGMMTYLYWTNGGHFVDMDDSAQPWPAFPDATAQFYASRAAVERFTEALQTLVLRTNSITGQPYRDDPTIFSWQLANEPRPGVSQAVVEENIDAYCSWIQSTARLIKSLDPNHLVATGSEGLVGSGNRADYYLRAHDSSDVDYLTAHIWPQNWNWITPHDLDATFSNAEQLTQNYIQAHIEFAQQLGRPLVIEEFGFPRDGGRFDCESSTHFRDRFYALIHDAVLESVRSNGPLRGSNFWAFGGEGRAKHADFLLQKGESDYLGDPPHEPQGWYSVFDTDQSTIHAIYAHAQHLKSL